MIVDRESRSYSKNFSRHAVLADERHVKSPRRRSSLPGNPVKSQDDPPKESPLLSKSRLEYGRGQRSSMNKMAWPNQARGPHRKDAADQPIELVCDYDDEPSALYELLEASNWEKAETRSQSHPHETRTWIVRLDRNKRVRWKLLPIHAAIIFQAPCTVVKTLLETYPGALTKRDDQGMLPLHLAFRHKHDDDDLLELLLTKYPDAVRVVDQRGRLPLEHGRECTYSSNLLRFYSDAVIASQSNDCSATAPTTLSTVQSTSDKMKQVDEDFRQRSRALEEKHLRDLRGCEQKWQQRLRVVETKHDESMGRARFESEHEMAALRESHKAEVQKLQDLLQSQGNKDKQAMRTLTMQVRALRSELDLEKKHRNEKQLENPPCDYNALNELLAKAYEAQFSVRELALRQQKELKSARDFRSKLIHTLVAQEDSNFENDLLHGQSLLEVCVTASHHKFRTRCPVLYIV